MDATSTPRVSAHLAWKGVLVFSEARTSSGDHTNSVARIAIDERGQVYGLSTISLPPVPRRTWACLTEEVLGILRAKQGSTGNDIAELRIRLLLRIAETGDVMLSARENGRSRPFAYKLLAQLKARGVDFALRPLNARKLFPRPSSAVRNQLLNLRNRTTDQDAIRRIDAVLLFGKSKKLTAAAREYGMSATGLRKIIEGIQQYGVEDVLRERTTTCKVYHRRPRP